MIFGLFLLASILVIWLLFVKGFLFKLIIFCFGWLGLYAFLWSQFPDSHVHAFNSGYSWAGVIPTVICVLALLTTKE